MGEGGATRGRGEDSPVRTVLTMDSGVWAALWEGAPRGGGARTSGERLLGVWGISETEALSGRWPASSWLWVRPMGRPRDGPAPKTEVTLKMAVVGTECAEVFFF